VVSGPTITPSGMSEDYKTATPEEINKESVSKQPTETTIKEGIQKFEDLSSLQENFFPTTALLLCMQSFEEKIISQIFNS
jgi:hypothetical protein